MKFSRTLLLPVVSMALSIPAFAEEQSPIIVTATRTAQTADESLASVTVISREDIEQSLATSISELLTGYAGIDSDTNGGMGQESNIYMRGTDKDHVLVLVDGIKFGSATTGRVALQYFPVSIIERIEIVRGPRSSLYGSEAISGVIQIFTKTDTKQSGGYAKATFGSYNTANFALGLNQYSKNSSFNLHVDTITTSGFDARVTRNPDDDGYNNRTVNANYSHTFGNQAKLDLQFLNSTGSTEYDGFSTSALYHREFIEQTLAAKAVIPVSKSWDMSIALTHSDDKRDSFRNDVLSNTYNTQRQRVALQNDLTISDSNLLTIGADYLKDDIESSRVYPVTKRSTKSAFIQHQWFGEENDILVSLRQDDIDDWGSHTTGSLAWGNQLTKDTRVTASYGTAFKAPTFNELYHPTTSSASPNPNLLAEESKSYEIGVAQNTTWGKWNAQVFRNDIKNLIVFGFPNNNIESAQIDGVELSASTNLAGWQTRFDVTVIDPVDSQTGQQLDRRSKETIKLNLDKKFGTVSAGITLLSQSSRMDDGVQVNGYNIINLRVKKQLGKSTSISLKGSNVTDKEYQTIDTYRMPGAAYYATLEHKF